MKKVWIALGVSLMVLTSFAAWGEWDRLADVPESTGNLAFSAAWDPGAGLHLKLTDGATNKTARFDVGRQTFSGPATNALPLTIQFRQETWSLYSQDRCLATIPAPFPLPAVVWQPAGERTPEGTAKPIFQKIVDFRFEDSFMRPEGGENSLGEWTVESGSWYLHTAKETAFEGAFLKRDSKRTPVFDFSPNFYSLAGKGDSAIITAGYDFYDNYSIEAGVRAEPGESGLVVYYQDSGACQAFTVKLEEGSDNARLTLWNVTSSNGVRKILGSVTTPLAPGQWVKLRVKTFENRVQCFMDQAKVFDLPVELPAGGRFGLFASEAGEARFDDVSVESTHDLDFRTAEDVRRNVLAEQGSFFPERRFFGLFPPSPDAPRLAPPVSSQPQWLVVGAAAHGPHVFGGEFTLEAAPFCVGLLAGWTGADQPHVRFTCRRTETNEIFLLESVSGTASKVLEELVVPGKADASFSGRVNLMFDASGDKEWRLYRNGELVLVHPSAPELRGASGLYVGPGTRTRLLIPTYAFKRGDLFKNRYEKNNRFSEDPFMKHWASPEGQWLEERSGLVWYTGDFFGRFSLRMPRVEASEIHLGVAEGATNGAWIVSVRDGSLSLRRGPEADARQPVLAKVPVTDLVTEGSSTWYTVQVEGRWLWVTSGDKTLLKQSLDQPLKGRRIRVAGFSTPQLKETYVERYNVKDFLFTESLFDWVVNGGRWEIVNRFQCDPRWSHMNGEGTNSLAALWAKYEIKGDFCIEMHAGQRMGWYERCGDLNMTVMSPETTPSQGYTITCTGWDPDSSQLYTTLYRNGVVMARSDQYLVPRRREGNKRFGYEPLVAGGRDVHGAWYYLKFRRIGHTLEYYFDNDLVFSVTDDQPLQGGMAGIWTYLNSMMVARVKVAAEEIRPRAVTLTPAPSSPAPPVVAPPSAGAGGLLKDGQPLSLSLPRFWAALDPVGRLRLDWREEPGLGLSFTAKNVAGSGNMLAVCSLPPVPVPDLAGWRFEVKRTPKAQFNFHYSVGRMVGDGVYVAERQFYHRLSGSDLDKGPYVKSGEATVVPAASQQVFEPAPWSPVTVWLANDLALSATDRTLMVKVEGFGNLQPSLVQQGLTGNGPGERYAVRDFTAITYSTPKLAESTNRPPPAAWAVVDPASGKKLAAFNNVAALQSWVNTPRTNGLICVSIRPEGTNVPAPATLAWIRLPPRPAVSASWHPSKPDTVALRCVAPYPDRRFLAAEVWFGDSSPMVFDEGFDTRVALVPRRPEFAGERIPVTVRGVEMSNTFSLAWKDAVVRDVPVLVSLAGATPFLQNAEPRERLAGLPAANPYRVSLAAFDPVQGSYFDVKNSFSEKRLRCIIPAILSLSRYPLFQFRYRTDDAMARVSMTLGHSCFVRISESNAVARPVRYATNNVVTDGAWQGWLGQVSDAIASPVYDRNLFQVNAPEIGSTYSIDQTGLFTRWALDDLVFGPAVSTAVQLALTPTYFDFSGIASVRLAVRAGPESFAALSAGAASALVWQDATNAVETVPRLEGLTDGIHHLFIQARARSGKESSVTDIPFLLDRKPLQGSAVFGSTELDARDNADFRVNLVSDGGAPLNLDTLGIQWQDVAITNAMPAMRLTRAPDRDLLSFNWVQYFREQLGQTTNGQTLRLSVTGIQDGAGNRSPDLVVPVIIDYAKDQVPPTLLRSVFPSNVFWSATWSAADEKNTFFVSRPGGAIEVVPGTNEPPYLRVIAGRSAVLTASIARTNWAIQKFPYLALRIRRPFVASTNDPALLQLSLELSSSNTVSVLLSPAKRGSSRSHYILPEPIVWRSNQWESAFLDIEAAVKTRFPTQSLEGLAVRSLTLRQTGPAPTDEFHLQSVFAYAPGPAADPVKINAYDASGMDQPEVSYETATGQPVELAAFSGSPAATNKPASGWMLFRAKDKAGNLTAPLRVPVWSALAPAGGL